MATHSLTENYRASASVLKYVNEHKPGGKGGILTQCDGDEETNPGLVCPPESEIQLGRGLPDAAAVACQILTELENKRTVAVLCRTNNQVRQWEAFLKNWKDPAKSNTFPLRAKTLLIEESPLKVHRLWPIWWFFHGYSHLHPVPSGQFHDWCKKLGLIDCEIDCEIANGCSCAADFKECVNYPTKEVSKIEKVSKIKVVKSDCPKAQQINGRIRDGKPILLSDALEKLGVKLEKLREDIGHEKCVGSIEDWFENHDLKEHLSDYYSQWTQMLSDIESESYHGEQVTWRDLWYRFEEYFEEITNHLPKDKVILSTIHKSKGCEFDTVFLWSWKDMKTQPKEFYVGCSRPRKNLYVLKYNLNITLNESPKRLAGRSDVTNISPLKPAFSYRSTDKENKDYTIIYVKNDITNIQKFFSEKPACDSLKKILKESLTFYLKNKNTHSIESEYFTFYFERSDHGYIPLFLPEIRRAQRKKR